MKVVLPITALVVAVAASASPIDVTRDDVNLALDTVNATAMVMPPRRLATNNLYVACGMDIPGNDIRSIPSWSADVCGLHCLLYKEECGSATWTDYQGGTCWLKRASNAVSDTIIKTGAVSFVPRAAGATAVLTIETRQGYDVPGNTIKTTRRDWFPDCVRDCEADPKCFAVSAVKLDGTCVLKSRASALVPRPGATLAIVARAFDFQGMCG